LKSYIGYGVALAIIIVVGAYVYMDANEVAGPRQLTALERVGDECGLIAEKAASALPEALPFQKLEKAARQSRVLQSCMNDRGYMENPAWVAYAEPIAKKTAEQANISVNEAYETLRRNKMVTFYESDAKTPLYWIPSKS
jgi:hypothetical protein